MSAIAAIAWSEAYRELLERLPALVARARLTFCGMGSCIDARIHLPAIAPLLDGDAPAEARHFLSMLVDRARRGIGGEVRVDWPEGPAWLSERLPIRSSLGGTGPHAAWVLTAAGAPAVVALEDRSETMLSHVPAEILVAEEGRLVPAGEARRAGRSRPHIFIFEYTAGRAIGDVVPARSSRIIVRFNDPDLEHDDAFDALTVARAGEAGAGLISAFNAVARDRLDGEIARVGALAGAWKAGGLDTVYYELGGFDTIEACRATLTGLRGRYDALGMSHSEYRGLGGAEDLSVGMPAMADELGLDRLVVHADHFAAIATRRDAARDRDALMAGCLIAASRAAAGTPVRPERLPEGARFAASPFDEPVRRGRWTLVSCASPYLETPATTLGLGDSFTGGCLLVFGQGSPPTR
ncbi:ADP-dependent glucokinase/phosphofructokinase [Prosthecomicrobium pneumaticum]|uniref:ADP-dependent phosphofructokinase/glucokinase n=1 Tax=Prosthecomicrobium pneumaticum TaxID=81895 RepID=A0A7W9FKU3_9HYPH|nr:ADP-dependent glucokinase/phosphofructokinase [Prosthecomicrobium pneumaticum]MBB5751573.1 ADP-dependent phosphofructokinase/glucokinase [Prosthecomicrobium pneumaticum]